MAERYRLRRARGARRIEAGGPRVLVKLRKLMRRVGSRQHRLVLPREPHRQRGITAIRDENEAIERGELPAQLLEHRQEVAMNQQYFGLRMVEAVGELL